MRLPYGRGFCVDRFFMRCYNQRPNVAILEIIYNLLRVSMKKANLLLTLLVVCIAVFVSGCSMEPKGFVQDTRPGLTNYEAHARIYRTVNMNGQMVWEDWDHFWMIERPSRLNKLRVQ
jgi:hypothetical protein